VVRPVTPQEGAEQRYEIIAGERRWRASQLAGLDTVPALVREVSDDDALAMALIENIQREDLTPIEEAQALARFVDEFGLTHQAAAEAVGRSRASVSNLIRLLELDPIVRSMMERGELDMGQGRALLALPSALQKQAAAEIVAKGLTARQTEALVRKLRGDAESDENLKKPKAVEPNVARLAQELSERLGSTVQIQHNAKGRGKLTIQFNSLDEFDGILERLND
jgi:ParB family chromosome partitioning protein